MLGTRTQCGRMVGADESTELWRHKKLIFFSVQVLVDTVPEGLRRVPEVEPISRSDIYGLASGPADSASAPSEQREIEAAVINGANAFGIPTVIT